MTVFWSFYFFNFFTHQWWLIIEYAYSVSRIFAVILTKIIINQLNKNLMRYDTYHQHPYLMSTVVSWHLFLFSYFRAILIILNSFLRSSQFAKMTSLGAAIKMMVTLNNCLIDWSAAQLLHNCNNKKQWNMKCQRNGLYMRNFSSLENEKDKKHKNIIETWIGNHIHQFRKPLYRKIISSKRLIIALYIEIRDYNTK